MEAFSYFLKQVSEQVEAHCAQVEIHCDQVEHVVAHIASMLEELLSSEPLHFQGYSAPHSHCAELLYQDTRTGFVAVLVVWGERSFTTIHEHHTWDVFGVIQGEVQVTNYQRGAEGESVEIAQFIAQEGDVTYLLPPDQAIHRIQNNHAGVSLTLHIYGRECDWMTNNVDSIG